MVNDTSDSVKDRFAERFEGEKDEKEKNEENSAKEQTSKNSVKAKKDKVSNIKEEWQNHSVYLDNELADRFGMGYKRLDLELGQDYGLSIKKTRHYYPLIVKLGLDKLEELESEEVKEELEELES
ncbi:hypothetical protein [Halopelagius fulvigenes]|uniref:DUF8160 domain-containing protein n=1 Tax=Halopelagius fulvigenes TaxID=1198324 RepID=A0ABD5TXJ8_9EURY